MPRNSEFDTYRHSYPFTESYTRPQSSLKRVKPFPFTGPRVLVNESLASDLQNSNTFVENPGTYNRLRKKASMEKAPEKARRVRPRITTSGLRDVSSGVSTFQACHTPNFSFPINSMQPSVSTTHYYGQPSDVAPEVAKSRMSRSVTTFIRKIFSCTKEKSSKASETPSKLEVKPQRITPGTGSELRDLRFLLGNDSLRICRNLCRIQDDDEKQLHLLSPRVGSLNFKVRQFDSDDAPHTLLLPATVFENDASDEDQNIMALFMNNFVSMLPSGTEKISRKANPAGLVYRLLPSPIIEADARYLGAAFWLWLCAIDDQIEELEQKDFEEAIEEIKKVFNWQDPVDPHSNVAKTSFALRDLVQQTELQAANENGNNNQDVWRRSFLDAIMEILHAFEGERPLLSQFKKGGDNVKLADWMELRLTTISARPFMVLARASLGLQPTLSSLNNTAKNIGSDIDTPTRRGRSDSAQTFTPDVEWEEEISRLEILAQCAMGLENDILGWEKDHAEQNILNSVEILFQNHKHRQSAMREMVLMHNYTVNKLCIQADAVLGKCSTEQSSPPVSPARTLFSVKSPWQPFTASNFTPFATSTMSPTDTDHKSKFLALIKHKSAKPDYSNESLNTNQAKYVLILLGFVKGMAVWTSQAKRYAV